MRYKLFFSFQDGHHRYGTSKDGFDWFSDEDPQMGQLIPIENGHFAPIIGVQIPQVPQGALLQAAIKCGKPTGAWINAVTKPELPDSMHFKVQFHFKDGHQRYGNDFIDWVNNSKPKAGDLIPIEGNQFAPIEAAVFPPSIPEGQTRVEIVCGLPVKAFFNAVTSPDLPFAHKVSSFSSASSFPTGMKPKSFWALYRPSFTGAYLDLIFVVEVVSVAGDWIQAALRMGQMALVEVWINPTTCASNGLAWAKVDNVIDPQPPPINPIIEVQTT